MRSRVFYIVYTLLSVLILLEVAGVLRPIWSFPLSVLMFFCLFLYIKEEFKDDRAPAALYLNIAIVAMFLGNFFLQRAYGTYSVILGLLFFLLANLSYTKLFYKFSVVKFKPLIPFILIAFFVVITIILKFYAHFGYYYGLGLVNLLVVLNCLQAAYLRNGRVPRESFRLVFYGMLLFFVVQVFSAYDHMELNLRWLEALTVGGFLISQVMIIRGLKKEKGINGQETVL